jgi:hypothetical protein
MAGEGSDYPRAVVGKLGIVAVRGEPVGLVRRGWISWTQYAFRVILFGWFDWSESESFDDVRGLWHGLYEGREVLDLVRVFGEERSGDRVGRERV